MNPSLRTAATGMAAQQLRVDVISNNLANVNTPAFKKSRAHFQDLLYQTVQSGTVVGEDGATSTEQIQIGRGTRLAGVQRIEEQGALEQTSRPLDVAIEGIGFLQVQLPTGATGYTRDGSLSISDQGVLVAAGGYPLVPTITIPPEATEIAVSRNGVVSAIGADAQVVELGRLELARFANPAGLRAMGENLFTESPASGQPSVGTPQEDGFGRIVQGYLESSNVEIVQEMVDMISALRAYEINSKAVKSAEEMSQTAAGLVR